MKTCFLALVLLFWQSCLAQAYAPLIRSGQTSYWSGFGFDVAPPPDNASWPIDLHSAADTVIAGVVYTAINDSHDLFYYLREDSMGRVFVLAARDSVEHLLYDFSLQVGDSIRDTLSGYSVSVNYIDSFHTVMGTMRRLHVTGTVQDTWIEGIGGSQLLNPFSFVHFEDGYCLREMSNAYGLMYQDTSCRQYSTGIRDVPMMRVQLYPVPASGVLYIQWTDDGKMDQGAITIRNMIGQTVLAENVEPFQAGMDISLNGISDGVYFADWLSQAGVVSHLGKFTIMK